MCLIVICTNINKKIFSNELESSHLQDKQIISKQQKYNMLLLLLPDFLSTTEMKYLGGSSPFMSPGHNMTLFSDRKNLKPSEEGVKMSQYPNTRKLIYIPYNNTRN